VPQFHGATITSGYGSTKQQCIGRNSGAAAKYVVMKDQMLTRTATAKDSAVRESGQTPAPVVVRRERTADANPTPLGSPEFAGLPGSKISTSEVRARRWSRKPQRFFLSAAATLGLCAAVCSLVAWWQHSRGWTKTDNAYVAGHVHSISSRVAGTVSEVLADENQAVEAGAMLARLDARDFQVRRQQAEAQVAQTQAQIQQAESQVEQARAQVAREQAHAQKAQRDLQRARSLFEGSAAAISKQELDAAQSDCDAAVAGLKAAEAALGAAQKLTEAARAQEKVAKAALEDAQLQISYTEIKAPASGIIGRKNLEVGNRVQPGQALLALVQTDVWVVANFKETQLAHLRAGQPVRIRLDAFPGKTFAGRVDSLSPASGAQFALIPPDNATGNFTRVVQRVPVKIVFDAADGPGLAGRIVPGMSSIVEVNTAARAKS
jgi:membrane fusion protein (multidrug efflux system)